MKIGFRLVLMFSYLQILTKHTACLIVFPLKLLSWFAMHMKSSFLWPVLLADKSCIHIKFTPWWSLKSHTDGMALSVLTSYCPKRKTAVKIFCSIMSLCSSKPKTTTTPNRKIPTCHGDTTMEPLLVHKKWRFPPIMLIVAGSYNENHMEASLFSEFWNTLLTLSMRIICTDWQNSVVTLLWCVCVFLSVRQVSDLHSW